MAPKSYEDDIQVIFNKIQARIGKKLPVRVVLKGTRIIDDDGPKTEIPLGRYVTHVTGLRIIGEPHDEDVEIIFKDKVFGSNRHTMRSVFSGRLEFSIPGDDGVFNRKFFTIHKK
jgi:hypothetical protein